MNWDGLDGLDGFVCCHACLMVALFTKPNLEYYLEYSLYLLLTRVYLLSFLKIVVDIVE